jgi:parallel beta-helix repeat protein
VTRNTAIGNGGSGILLGANSTVTHNTADHNDIDGISVDARSLVSHNTVNDNAQVGIEAFCPSTVTNNTASNNGENFSFVGDGCFEKNNTSPDEVGCLTGDGELALC